ncbi:FecR domain-containing protein [Pseudomonas monteilii]|uniref:FecR domain-containing protein n=1 Tax=Pseudomonas monteilii TaxID=76759 RepID=UPI00383A4FA2
MTNDAQRQALRHAAQWFAHLSAKPDDPALHAQWQHWHSRSAEHEWAWQQLTELQARLGRMPQQLAWDVMEKSTLRESGPNRRTLLKGLLLGAGASSLAWQGYGVAPKWMADITTRIGEQRQEVLADGTLLVLDTDTALDVVFNASTRLLILRAGEVHVTTGKDSRPFLVRSAQGELRALGTRFAVRQLDGLTRLSVYQHAVAVRPERVADEAVIEQGQSVTFDRQRLLDTQALKSGEEAWAQGRLVVEGWRLDRLVDELQRYCPGYLGCAAEVSHLRVSGSYLLGDIELTLNTIARSLPVRIQQRTRYWTRILPV